MASKDVTLSTFLQEKVEKRVPYIMSVIEQRAHKMTPADKERCEEYVSLNLFTSLEHDQQLACHSIILESEHLRELKHLTKINKKYDGDEPIFAEERLQEAIVHDGDIIDYAVIDRVPNTNISKIGNRYVRLDSRIPMDFYHWLEDCFAQSSKAVRVEPDVIYDQMPSQMVVECLINPPKRDWWKNLNIYNRESNGSSYILLGGDVNDVQDYNDYNRLNIRKLQISVTRQNARERGAGNMSMMIEELTKIYECNDPAKSYMIGRMIHLDTDAKMGTPFQDAVLNHIDLAENLYVGDAACKRDSQDLSTVHSVVDATNRTHLLRVDNIPFESIFKFAYAFFKSKRLVDEWKAAEFSS